MSVVRSRMGTMNTSRDAWDYLAGRLADLLADHDVRGLADDDLLDAAR